MPTRYAQTSPIVQYEPPDLGNPESLKSPFIDRQGNGEQSYMIQMIGETEKAKILADEKQLIDDLCAYRDVLCLDHTQH